MQYKEETKGFGSGDGSSTLSLGEVCERQLSELREREIKLLRDEVVAIKARYEDLKGRMKLIEGLTKDEITD
jgi:hypothetical protein